MVKMCINCTRLNNDVEECVECGCKEFRNVILDLDMTDEWEVDNEPNV